MLSRTRHVRVERVALEDHRDVPLLGRQLGHVPAADQQAAARRGLQPGDHPQHRALAAARRSDQHDELAVLDRRGPGPGRPRGRWGTPWRCLRTGRRPWLTLHRAGRETLHDAPLEGEHEHRHRGGGDERGGEDLAPGHLVLPAEQRDRDRDRLALGSEGEREREQELVPAVHEGQDRGGREPRERQRHDDLAKGPEPARAVHPRRLLQLRRELPEESDQQPDGERHREGEVGQDETGIGVDQPQRPQQQVERRHHRDLGEHPDGEDDAEEQPLAPEVEAGERVGAESADRRRRRGSSRRRR